MSANCESSDFTSRENGSEETECEIKFTPPLYRQRYIKVYEILMAENVASVADYGCSECQSLRIFRNLPSVELLYGVDIDRNVLENKIQGLQPLITDYICRRPRPLKILLFHGNILKIDERLSGVEAITMIEVIEHLNSEDLDKLPSILFGHLHPKIVIFTTPNAEFNVLFPNLVGFRHADHKFEWTRSQFSNWCNKVADEYSYSVEYGGMGDPPPDRTNLGFCSQFAVFRRSHVETELSASHSAGYETYTLVGEVVYPTQLKTTTLEEDILYEAVYFINLLTRRSRDDIFEADEPDDQVVKLEDLKSFSRLQHSIENYSVKLREILKNSGYHISEDGLSVICAHDEDEDSHSLSSGDADVIVGDEEIAVQNPTSTDIHPISIDTENWDL